MLRLAYLISQGFASVEWTSVATSFENWSPGQRVYEVGITDKGRRSVEAWRLGDQIAFYEAQVPAAARQ